MEDASPATFRPTWRQALARGLYLGALFGVVGITVAVVLGRPVLAFAPVVVGAVIGVLIRRFAGVELGERGIRTGSGFAPWHRVVDMRAERRGKRTVVSIYLDSGASVQLQAPYSGDLFAADPHFESKMFTLSHLWRSHRFGGLPG
jgi:hypothetical protein